MAVIPAYFDLTVVPGEDLDVLFQLTEDDGATPVDLTGWTDFQAQLRERWNKDVLAECVVSISLVDDAGAAVTPAAGWIRVEMLRTETAKLAASTRYEQGAVGLFGTNSFGQVKHLGEGEWFRFETATVPA